MIFRPQKTFDSVKKFILINSGWKLKHKKTVSSVKLSNKTTHLELNTTISIPYFFPTSIQIYIYRVCKSHQKND